MNCKNCSNLIDSNFCANCGQSTKVEKLNLPNFLTEISDSVFQLNRGLLYTIKELFTRPGHSIREFIQGKRKNYFKPIAYALMLSTVYFIISQITDEKTIIGAAISGFVDASTEDELKFNVLSSSLNWLANNIPYAMLILIPVYALASYISFLGKGYNYLEHIVLNSYIVAQQAIIYSIFLIPSFFISNDYLENFALIISVAYAFWTFKTFFNDLSISETILRSVLIYLLIITFILAILMVITIPEFIIKKN